VPLNLSRPALYAAPMSPRADPLRLYAAHRAAIAERLVSDARILPDSAERWIEAWEAEARLRGLDAWSPEQWRPAWTWIAEQRGEPPGRPLQLRARRRGPWQLPTRERPS
jgi:hypothetical protein